jgi:hypothetical protein
MVESQKESVREALQVSTRRKRVKQSRAEHAADVIVGVLVTDLPPHMSPSCWPGTTFIEGFVAASDEAPAMPMSGYLIATGKISERGFH